MEVMRHDTPKVTQPGTGEAGSCFFFHSNIPCFPAPREQAEDKGMLLGKSQSSEINTSPHSELKEPESQMKVAPEFPSGPFLAEGLTDLPHTQRACPVPFPRELSVNKVLTFCHLQFS